MVDIVDKATRRRIMQSIKSENTGPEKLFAWALKELGLKSGRWDKKLPGRPDFTLKPNVAVFIDGCFFHACPRHATLPKTNTAFWRSKFSANRKRDLSVDIALRNAGWRSIRFWECEVRRSAIDCAMQVAEYAT